ncbi:kynureninase [Pseudobacter ginsenosidimutans]|uniref:Kynureninase n=1 Tax=Pseudobacter ginsenosidimutans TaxID=661488 RepID=A0A4Q7MKG3_9BACT|nr:kynureninase [Pseudobacter ginsenosidimutans]RZS67069.1 kynureninase [Pseudobacter ginsenosidimutans]
MNYQNTLEFAQQADQQDPLRSFRERFLIPQVNGKDAIYFTGNSLGLQPKTVRSYVQQELDDWAEYGVEGHFHAKNPWFSYHEIFPEKVSKIVGALPEEVVVMNQLTVNLHLLMVSFYRPTKQRFKIICEAKAFPSDQYALETQLKFHGYDLKDALVEIAPRQGEHTMRIEDILTAIDTHKDSLALVMFGGVNYYSGQVLDMKTITEAAHKAGAIAGFDLAHGAGNIPLELHNWNVDFACWCSYKYLNSGPGGVAGAFVHQKHLSNKELPRFAGWWGHTKETRFLMQPGFDPIPTAEGWQLSNAPVLSMAAHKASVDIFDEAGMPALVKKGKAMSGYLQFILEEMNAQSGTKVVEVITPKNESERGCQVSLLMLVRGKEVFKTLMDRGVIADWREPNVIRVAPVPMYNKFEDVWMFGQIIKEVLATSVVG